MSLRYRLRLGGRLAGREDEGDAVADSHLALDASAEQGCVRLSDTSCGRCARCNAGWLLWCSSPGVLRRSVLVDIPGVAAEELRTTLATASALNEASVEGRVVLVHGDPPGAVAAAAVAMGAHAVLNSGEPVPGGGDGVFTGSDDEVRRQLAGLTPTGRADVVAIANGDARRALRAVVRGGHLAIASSVVPAITVTEVVQRELHLAGPKDVWSVLSQPTGSDVLQAVKLALTAEQ